MYNAKKHYIMNLRSIAVRVEMQMMEETMMAAPFDSMPLQLHITQTYIYILRLKVDTYFYDKIIWTCKI